MMKESFAICRKEEDASESDQTSFNDKINTLEDMEVRASGKVDDGCTSEETKQFDDSCFKTPLLPIRYLFTIFKIFFY